MTDPARILSPQIITIFGGSGFLGAAVAAVLTRRNYRMRIAVRRPNLAGNVMPFGFPGQIHPVQANVRYRDSVERALRGASIAINLVGILRPSGKQSFQAVHAEGTKTVAETAATMGVRLIHISALGADPASPSAYARTKAQGEAAVRTAAPEAVIFRPSVVFGPGDSFFNRFGSLVRFMPVLPIAGADTRFQPVYVGDVARAIGDAVDGSVQGGLTYELGGPETKTLRELIAYVLAATERRARIIALPPSFAHYQAAVMELAHFLSLGLMPEDFMITRDQVALLQRDNVVSQKAIVEGRTLEGLGITPTALEAIVPSYLARFRKRGQFEPKRAAEFGSATPDDLARRSAGPRSGFHPGHASGPAVGERTSR